MNSDLYLDEGLVRMINGTNPSVIISTFLHSTNALLRFRREGLIDPDVKIAWMITDYTDQHKSLKLPSLELDQTFLPAQGMRHSWITGKIPPEKVTVVGMPVNPKAKIPLTPDQRDAFVTNQLHLDPTLPIVSIAGGGGGMADYVDMVKQIAKNRGKYLA
jgi:UDP-N-acetylglucosamine:LPS N-acetylglucosamine transferase